MNAFTASTASCQPDSKDIEKLCAWAFDYRRAQGREHLCPQRTINAAKRAQGYLTNHPRKPRNVYEREQEIEAAEPGSRKRALLEQQERRGKELKARTEQMRVAFRAEKDGSTSRSERAAGGNGPSRPRRRGGKARGGALRRRIEQLSRSSRRRRRPSTRRSRRGGEGAQRLVGDPDARRG